jgi:hypothetical protein
MLLFPPHLCNTPNPSHCFKFYHAEIMQYRSWILQRKIVSSLLLLPPLKAQIFYSALYFPTPPSYVPPLMRATNFHTHIKQQNLGLYIGG